MLKDQVQRIVKDSIKKAIDNSELGELKEVPDFVPVENTKDPKHGDRAISMAMSLTKLAKIPPRKIAEAIVGNLNSESFKNVEIAGPGFINISFNWSLLEDVISEIHKLDTEFGKLSKENRADKSYEKVLLEYVSANPTGDLHIGHGRQAVLGSALVSLLQWAGYYVEPEFYINDAGVQIEKLALSLKNAMLIKSGKKKESEYPEGTYPLESMLEFFKPEDFNGDVETIPMHEFGEIGKAFFLNYQKELLSKIGVDFKTWFSEKKLHKSESGSESKVHEVMSALEKSGKVYEKDGAKWFKAEDFGDERDRVLVKSDESYTYLTGDVAYHQDKLARGFDKLINVWGADHHGQEVGLKGALQALGEPADRLEVVFIQMVSLKEGDTAVKMSKRAGTVVTVRDVVDEVGVDAFRYFLVESQANNHVAFDLDLAKKQDKDNPVYYIQYAHARSCSILRTLGAEQINQETKSAEKPILSASELKAFLTDFKKSSNLFTKFENLSEEEEASTKALILHLANFPEEIKDAALKRAPYKIATYLKDLASLFHQFYTHNRVMVDDKDLLKARLSLVVATQKVIRNGLSLLGISAPEKM